MTQNETAPVDLRAVPTTDLVREYFNLRDYLQFEYARTALPPILYLLMFVLSGWFIPEVSDGPAQVWYAAVMPFLTALAAFTCAGGIVYFGQRAWRGTRLAIAMHRELQTRPDKSLY